MNRNPSLISSSLSPSLTRSLLLAAVFAALPALTACERSGSEAANVKAAKAADEAARLTLSAGEVRASENLMKMDLVTPESLKAAKAEMTKKIEADPANTKAWKEYLDQRTVAADLKIAQDGLAAALKTSDFDDPAYQQLVQNALGATASASAVDQLGSLGDHLIVLADKAAAIEILAQRINTLGTQADVNGKRPSAAPTAEELTAAKNKLDAAIADESAKAAGIKALEAEISQKRAKAAEIYSKTEADIAASDQLKGNAAIDAANKAAEARKEADSLTEQVANILPRLASAQNELAVAALIRTEAQSQFDGLNATAKVASENSSAASKLSGEQREQAKKLVEGENGLAAQLKSFDELVTTIDGELANASKAADTAAKGYADAATKLSAYQRTIADKFKDAKNEDDPLQKITKNKLPNQLFQLEQSAARQQAGRVQLVAWAAASLQKTTLDTSSKAYKKAGLSLPASDAKDRAQAAADAAVKEFDAAIDLARTAASTGPETSPVKWLGPTLIAVSNHGKFVVTGNAEFKTEAQAAAQEALRLNPRLQLGYLTAAK